MKLAMHPLKRRVAAFIAMAAATVVIVFGSTSPASAEVSIDPVNYTTSIPSLSEGDVSAQACTWSIEPPQFNNLNAIYAIGESKGCSSSWNFEMFIERHQWHGWTRWSDRVKWTGNAYKQPVKGCLGSGNHNYRTAIIATGPDTGYWPAERRSTSRRYTC
jgi:hypothetical protein